MKEKENEKKERGSGELEMWMNCRKSVRNCVRSSTLYIEELRWMFLKFSLCYFEIKEVYMYRKMC